MEPPESSAGVLNIQRRHSTEC